MRGGTQAVIELFSRRPYTTAACTQKSGAGLKLLLASEEFLQILKSSPDRRRRSDKPAGQSRLESRFRRVLYSLSY